MEAAQEPMLSEASLAEIEHELAKYPADRRQSALLAALRIAQDEHRWLSNELIEYIAEVIGVPAVRAYEVATFYSMFQTKPVGRHNVAICTNVSCMLRGADDIVEHVENKLGIKLGESTEDGKFYLKREEECLAACCGAPMMMVDHKYYEDLTTEKVDKILDGLD